MNLLLTLVVIAGTYGLASALLSALGRAAEERAARSREAPERGAQASLEVNA